MTSIEYPECVTEPRYDARAHQYEAQVEDDLADWQASLVLLFADDALQTLAKGLLRKRHRSYDGYGPEYPDVTNMNRPVKLTTLLRAGTNAIRHVSEWDVEGLSFPYPALNGCSEHWRQAVQSIDVIQRVFGLGRNDPIRDVVSMRTLIHVDGTLCPGVTPTYRRFETSIVEAARDVARSASGDALDKLEAQLATATGQDSCRYVANRPR